MENEKKQRRKRTGKVYYYPNGIKTEFKFGDDSDLPPLLSMWLKEKYPNSYISNRQEIRQ
jgi:hypothetical protein